MDIFCSSLLFVVQNISRIYNFCDTRLKKTINKPQRERNSIMNNVVEFINNLTERIGLNGIAVIPTKCGCRIRDMYSGNCIYIRAVSGCPEYFQVRPTPRGIFVLLRPDEIREMLMTGNYPDRWTLEDRILEERRRKRKHKPS